MSATGPAGHRGDSAALCSSSPNRMQERCVRVLEFGEFDRRIGALLSVVAAAVGLGSCSTVARLLHGLVESAFRVRVRIQVPSPSLPSRFVDRALPLSGPIVRGLLISACGSTSRAGLARSRKGRQGALRCGQVLLGRDAPTIPSRPDRQSAVERGHRKPAPAPWNQESWHAHGLAMAPLGPVSGAVFSPLVMGSIPAHGPGQALTARCERDGTRRDARAPTPRNRTSLKVAPLCRASPPRRGMGTA